MGKFNLGMGAARISGKTKGEKGKPKPFARITLRYDKNTGWFLVIYPSDKGVDFLNQNCWDNLRNEAVTTAEMDDKLSEISFSKKAEFGENYKLRTKGSQLPRLEVPLYGLEPKDKKIVIRQEQCESWIDGGALYFRMVRRLELQKIGVPVALKAVG